MRHRRTALATRPTRTADRPGLAETAVACRLVAGIERLCRSGRYQAALPVSDF